MAKKLKLQPNLSSDFTIIGISCHLKDYLLTYQLNRSLNFSFKRIADLMMHDEQDRIYTFYTYYHNDERRNYVLISNYHTEGKLIPALTGADYFLFVDDILNHENIRLLTRRVSSIQNVLTAFEVPQESIKDIPDIVSEVELHLLESRC
jgi:hypothetical protein